MRGLNAVKYDASKQQMTVGGGIATGEFANATFSKGMEVSKYYVVPINPNPEHDMINSCWILPLHRRLGYISRGWYRTFTR